MCNMLCLPDCMFADDAAQSIIAFLTVVCRHTGGRYIAPEVSMHNTRMLLLPHVGMILYVSTTMSLGACLLN